MKVFVSGTDTNIGKTFISGWLCLHLKYEYFKPIQTGALSDSDSQTVSFLSGVKTYRESYLFREPVSPHIAAKLENQEIDFEKINIPQSNNLIIEGAGGLLVPLNTRQFIIDLIEYFSVPVLLVSHSRLGTINHTLLSIEALKQRRIPLLGVIMIGEENPNNKYAIEFYGHTQVVMEMPLLACVNKESLMKILVPRQLKNLLMEG